MDAQHERHHIQRIIRTEGCPRLRDLSRCCITDIIHRTKPKGLTISSALTVGPGVQFREAYDFMHTLNRTLVGGGCDTGQ